MPTREDVPSLCLQCAEPEFYRGIAQAHERPVRTTSRLCWGVPESRFCSRLYRQGSETPRPVSDAAYTTILSSDQLSSSVTLTLSPSHSRRNFSRSSFIDFSTFYGQVPCLGQFRALCRLPHRSAICSGRRAACPAPEIAESLKRLIAPQPFHEQLIISTYHARARSISKISGSLHSHTQCFRPGPLH